VDWLDRCSTNFGTTGEQVYGSADAADSWNRIVQTLGWLIQMEALVLLPETPW
jgi:hypothetical protein